MSSVFGKLQSIGTIKTTRTIDLGDCDEAFRGAVFDVWVTPTRAHWQEFWDYVRWLNEEPERAKERRDQIEDETERAEFDREHSAQMEREMWQRLDHWLAETWTNIPAGEVTQIREHLQESFPDAWTWLYNRTLSVIREHRESLTKN